MPTRSASTLSRRGFLQGAATAAVGLSLPARAAGATNLRGGEILPDPDFSALRESSPYVIGVRPHRKGGVHLALDDAPLPGPTGSKQVIHNYGHGGAGITLSWGCASVATELMTQAMARRDPAKEPHSVAVLGTGVIGLTTATELRRRWPALPITVYARDLDVRSTTSFIAGGQFEPSGIIHEYDSDEGKKTMAELLRRAHTRIVGLQASPDRTLFGVAERKDYTLDHEARALDVFTPTDVIPAPRKGRLPFQRLNTMGREYSTWLMNPMILLPKLVADLKAAGVAFEQRTFAKVADVAALQQNIVVNCTGYGAKQLFDDPNVVPQRGHLVVLKRTDPGQLYFFSDGCANLVIAYVFCRQDDIVVGGTVQSGNDSLVHGPEDQAVFQRLLSNGRELFAGHAKACAAS